MSAPDRGEVRERIAREIQAAKTNAILAQHGEPVVGNDEYADRILRALREGREPVAYIGRLQMEQLRARGWGGGCIYADKVSDPTRPDEYWTAVFASPAPPEPVESERDGVSHFLALLVEHAYPVRDHEKYRVPEGTKSVGSAWIAPNGEIVIADGSPSDERDPEHPLAHNCDEMGCSSVSHVIARLRAPTDEGGSDG